jgi:hypothetical protein
MTNKITTEVKEIHFNKNSSFSKNERELLIELISNEQIHMIIKHPERYSSDKYKMLEHLKVKIKDFKNTKEKNKTVKEIDRK